MTTNNMTQSLARDSCDFDAMASAQEECIGIPLFKSAYEYNEILYFIPLQKGLLM